MGTTESKFIAFPFRRLPGGSAAPPIVITAETLAHAIHEFNMKLVDYFQHKSFGEDSDKVSDTANVALCYESMDPHALWLFFDRDPTRSQLSRVDQWIKRCPEHPVIPKSVAPLTHHFYVVSGSRYWMLDIDKPGQKTAKETSKEVSNSEAKSITTRRAMIQSILGHRHSMRQTDIAVLCTLLGGTMIRKKDLQTMESTGEKGNPKVHILTRDRDDAKARKEKVPGGEIDVNIVSVRTLIHDHICGEKHRYTSDDIQHFTSLYENCKQSMRWSNGRQQNAATSEKQRAETGGIQ